MKEEIQKKEKVYSNLRGSSTDSSVFELTEFVGGD
jgi:hypothetical protein